MSMFYIMSPSPFISFPESHSVHYFCMHGFDLGKYSVSLQNDLEPHKSFYIYL